MKKLLLFVSATLFCASAGAAQIRCSGEAYGYRYSFRASVQGSRVIGTIRGVVSGGLLPSPQAVVMRATWSDVRPGSHIRVLGAGATGSGRLSATYDRSSRAYVGTMTVRTHGITANGGTFCRLSQVSVPRPPSSEPTVTDRSARDEGPNPHD